ncbi:hypothetical protein CVT26_015478, partial [Gymnopilus dilepis]
IAALAEKERQRRRRIAAAEVKAKTADATDVDSDAHFDSQISRHTTPLTSSAPPSNVFLPPATPEPPPRPGAPVFGLSANQEIIGREWYIDADGITRPVPPRPKAPAFGRSTNHDSANHDCADSSGVFHPIPIKNRAEVFLKRLPDSPRKLLTPLQTGRRDTRTKDSKTVPSDTPEH